MTEKMLPGSQSGNPIVQSVRQVRLVIRLLLDPRVSAWNKLVMFGAGVYAASPIDLLMIPGISAADDIVVLTFASMLFISLCPPKIVKELAK